MDEIKETLSILKARWFEVVLIIGLVTLPVPLMRLLLTVYPPKAAWMIFANRGIMLLHICILLFVLLISGGFLRTVYLEDKKRQRVFGLIKAGKHFFSRLFRFGILFTAAVMIPLIGLCMITQARVSDANFQANLTFVIRIARPIINLILIKPILLIPAIIIVLDCELFKSFGLMRQIRLLDAKPLVTVFLVQLVLWLFFPSLPQGSLWQYPVTILYNILLNGLLLAAGIMAVRFVGSTCGGQAESE